MRVCVCVCIYVCTYIYVLNVEQVCMYSFLSFRFNGSDRNGYLKFMQIYIRLSDIYTCMYFTYRVSRNKRIGIPTTDSPCLLLDKLYWHANKLSENKSDRSLLRHFFSYSPASEESSRLESEPLTLRIRRTPGEISNDWLSDTAFVFFCPNEIFIKHGFSVTSRTNYNINNHRRSVSLFRAQQWVY